MLSARITQPGSRSQHTIDEKTSLLEISVSDGLRTIGHPSVEAMTTSTVPPLYTGDVSEEGGTTRRKPRRSKEQIEQEKADQKAEKERLKALFDGGDVTFTTLGVIDINLGMKGKGRKKKREKEEETVAAGKENRESDQAAPAPSKKRRSRGDTRRHRQWSRWLRRTTSTAARPDSSVVRAILFR